MRRNACSPEARRGVGAWRLMIVAGASLGCLLLTSCGGTQAASTDGSTTQAAVAVEEVRLVDVPGGGLALYPQIIAAQQAGFFKENNLEVARTDSNTSSNAIQLLITGNADIATVTPDLAIQAIGKGGDLVVLAATATEAPYYLESRDKFDDPKDFAGKKLGVPQLTGTATFLARVALGKAGVPQGSYELIVTGQATQRLTAMSAGAVDATMLPAPLNFNAEGQGFNRMMYIGDAVDAPGAVLVATRSFVESHRAATVSFLKAFLEARAWLYDPANRDKFLTAVAADSMGKGISKEQLDKTYDEFIVKRQINPPVGEVDLSTLAETMVEYGEMPSVPDVDKMIDNSLLDEARK